MKRYIKPSIEQTEICGSAAVMLSMSDGLKAGSDTKVLSPGSRFGDPFGGGFGTGLDGE